MPEHLLDAAEVGPTLEQVRREGMAQQVGVDALRLEPGPLGEAPEDQERASAGQRATLRVEEQLRTVAPVEERTAVREVAAQGLDRVAADGDDPLLAALAGARDEPALRVDVGLAEPDGFAHPKTRAVEELDERTVAERARGRPRRSLDQALRLGG